MLVCVVFSPEIDSWYHIKEFQTIREKGTKSMGLDIIDHIVQRFRTNVITEDAKEAIKKMLTTPDLETGMMPLTLAAMQGRYDDLRTILWHVSNHYEPMEVMEIAGAQPKGSRYDSSLDFEDPSDRTAYKLDPSWTLYHAYAAAGLHVREKLNPLIQILPVKHNTVSSGLFRRDRHDRTPFELAMLNCDPTSAVFLLQKLGEVSKSLGLYDLKAPILDQLRRVSDDRTLLPCLYEKKELGLLSNKQFMKMAQSYRDCDPQQMFAEMNMVLGTAIDCNDLGFLRAVFETFPYGENGHAFMDESNEEDYHFMWEWLCERTESELESDRKSGTMNVPLSVLMLRDCMEHVTNVSLHISDTDSIQERDKAMASYPLTRQALDELSHSNDTVSFYWAPDVVSERLRVEHMQQEGVDDEFHIG